MQNKNIIKYLLITIVLLMVFYFLFNKICFPVYGITDFYKVTSLPWFCFK